MKDTAINVRSGEEIDPRRLADFLKDRVEGIGGDFRIRQFPGGFSNLTYLVTSGDLEMVLRRPPIGANIKSAHDMGREYRILTALFPHFPYCPEPLAYCEEPSVIGGPFYVMRRFSGVILRKELPEGLTFSASDARKLCRRLMDVHAELHAIDVPSAGLEFLGKPEGYVRRQVDGWSGRYRKARTEDAPAFEEVMAWLDEKAPADTEAPVIVHNDFKFDNVVLDISDPLKIIGVLDWEMATYGDPLMDLGNSLAYWIEKNDPPEMQAVRVMPTHIDGALTRRELIDRYGAKTGRDMSDFDYYYCFGLFRLSVIAQQIYRRFHQGLTKDRRFGMLIHAVRILEKAALNVIQQTHL